MTTAVKFKSFKGINLRWGRWREGNEYNRWLTDLWSLEKTYEAFSSIRVIGIQTVSISTWVQRMVNNFANITDPDWTPDWNGQYIFNFESLLRDVVEPLDMEVVCTLGSEVLQNPIPGFNDPNSPVYWRWIDLCATFVKWYRNRNCLGRNIAGWTMFNEAAPINQSKMMVDFYKALKSYTHQPISVDLTINEADPYLYLTNRIALVRSACDFYCLHIYSDNPVLLNIAWDKPIVIGECGASEANFHYADPVYNVPSLQKLHDLYSQSATMLGIWPFSWSNNRSIVKWNGVTGIYELAPAGELIKSW